MFKHMINITKLEIKSTINVLIQINGEDQDMSSVEMELEFIGVDFRELTMVIKRML